MPKEQRTWIELVGFPKEVGRLSQKAPQLDQNCWVGTGSGRGGEEVSVGSHAERASFG